MPSPIVAAKRTAGVRGVNTQAPVGAVAVPKAVASVARTAGANAATFPGAHAANNAKDGATSTAAFASVSSRRVKRKIAAMAFALRMAGANDVNASGVLAPCAEGLGARVMKKVVPLRG